MILRSENELVLAGIEAVYGTAEVLAAADAIQCDIELTVLEAQQKVREYSRPYDGERPVIHTERHRSCRMRNVEIAGSGNPAAAPAWTRLLRACGWAAVTTATETTHTPVQNATDSLTIDPSMDTELFRMVGSRGNLETAKWMVGEFPVMDFMFKGGWVDVSTYGAIPTPDYSAWEIPKPVNCTETLALDVDGELYPVYEFEFGQNADVDFYCVPGEPGSRIETHRRKMRGRAKLQAKQSTEHDLFAMVHSNALFPVAFVHGVTAGHITEIDMPAVQFVNPRKSDYKGDLAWEVDILITPTAAGNDEVSWVQK